MAFDGQFDPLLVPAVWFDDVEVVEGWFDRDLPTNAVAANQGGDPAPLPALGLVLGPSGSNVSLTIPAASVVLTDALPALARGLSVPAASVVLTGLAPALRSDLALPLSSVVLTGYVPTLAIGTNVTAPAASITLTDYAPTLTHGLAVPVAGVVLTDYAPTLAFGSAMPVASVTITDYPPVLLTGTVLQVPSASIVLTSYAPALQFGITIPVASVTLTAQSPAAQWGFAVPNASITLTSLAPTLSNTSGNIDLTIPLGGLVLTGYEPTITGVTTTRQVSAGKWTRKGEKLKQSQDMHPGPDAVGQWVWRGHIEAQKARVAREASALLKQAKEDAQRLTQEAQARFEAERPRRVPEIRFEPPALDLSAMADSVAAKVSARIAVEYADQQRVAELRLLVARDRHQRDEEAITILLLS